LFLVYKSHRLKELVTKRLCLLKWSIHNLVPTKSIKATDKTKSSSPEIKFLKRPKGTSIQINRFKLRRANSNWDRLFWNKKEKEAVDREVMAVVVAELRDEKEEAGVVKCNDGY
jgi:hypothetical protein